MQERPREPNGKGKLDPNVESRMHEPATDAFTTWSAPRAAPPLPPVAELRPGRWRRMTRQLRTLGETATSRVGAWVAPALVTLSATVLVQAGGLIYWIGRTNTVMEQHSEDLDRLLQFERANATLGRDYDELSEWAGVIVLYESKIRELLAAAGVDHRDLPPLPTKPSRKRGD